MYIHQHRQNNHKKTAFLLVVLHKNQPEKVFRREIALTNLEIVLNSPAVICALQHKICEIIFTQYTYIVFRDMPA